MYKKIDDDMIYQKYQKYRKKINISKSIYNVSISFFLYGMNGINGMI